MAKTDNVTLRNRPNGLNFDDIYLGHFTLYFSSDFNLKINVGNLNVICLYCLEVILFEIA